MRSNRLFSIFITIFIIFLSAGNTQAITVSASPNPASVNQIVTVNVSATLSTLVTPSCTIRVSFGDNTYEDRNCGFPECNFTVNHTYNTPSTYTITAGSVPGICMTPPLPPDPATTQIVIQCPGGNLNIISASPLLAGTIGQPYSYQLQTTGGQPPFIFNLVEGSLPPGLNLSANGLISGIPTTTGNYSFGVIANDDCQDVHKAFNLTIGCPPLTITSPSTLASGILGQAYSYQLQTTGGQPPITFTLVSGTLPSGLNLSSNGLISGIPTAIGNYTFTVTASDACQIGAQSIQQTFTIQIQPPPVNVIPIPSSFNIPRGQSSSVNVNYQFTGTPSLNVTLNSSSGSFMVGNESIETSGIPLSVNIQNGTARISEVINVPVRVIERALQRKTNRFSYVRTFIDQYISITAIVNFTITTEAGADFAIQRVELYFDNRRPEITVERNYKNLKAYADFRFMGSGILQGYWEVDGRILSHVNQHLTFGKGITISTPEIPPLPTFDAGSHIVKFIITNPATEIPLPSIVYFVIPSDYKIVPLNIMLISPKDNSIIDYTPLEFIWEQKDGAPIFLLNFYDNLDAVPIFSAYTKTASYALPEFVLKSKFSPDNRYYWKVIGFDAESNIAGESNAWSFSFKKLDTYVPGQIITVFSESTYSEQLLKEIINTYKLKMIEVFSLKSINQTVVLLKTLEEDIFSIIEKLTKDSRVLIAQPNYILRTMSDPLRKTQYASNILKIDKIHTEYKGKGIKIAIVDTGVDTGHTDLKGRIIFQKNFIRDEAYVSEIHGTAVAGVVSASINGFGIEGVAPEAEILALRACRQVSSDHPEGDCFTESLAKALDEAILQKTNIVNMSFGTLHYDRLIAELIDKGIEKEILFVAPAGNHKNEKELRFPASLPSVISVGGFDESFIPYPNPDIIKAATVSAPAVNIITTFPYDKHNFLSGTSLSSAYISGILALALENNKSLSKKDLPFYKGDICKWEEELLKITICGK